ncbi:hypothetical protein AVEN_201820-1 [Araneus ventricosus]|uniref:Uncharacterized protein n=1 Tax=Araneus ventricosus TaxID=182803 RepID=A0A4Y2PMA0_ARAVE|nr:hypothetical protein AVEN_156811-1 [Araneus ventricosus]GBN52043.1 hypothetical protein AVEN_201820-1 [Araneus ventricosus]
MTPKGTANVLTDSDGFLGIVAALCVKPFLCARLVSDVPVQLSCCLPPISKGTALFSSWELCSREGNITIPSWLSDTKVFIKKPTNYRMPVRGAFPRIAYILHYLTPPASPCLEPFVSFPV